MQSRNKLSTAKRVARDGALVGLALIFSYVEHLIPINAGVPGIKIGLANLVVLSCLFMVDTWEVLVILIARILLAGLLFGNMSTVLYSLAGGLLSFLIMVVFKKLRVFGVMGISILGGVFHNFGQILVAMLVLSNKSILLYLPILVISGALAGTLVGIVSKRIVKVSFKDMV